MAREGSTRKRFLIAEEEAEEESSHKLPRLVEPSVCEWITTTEVNDFEDFDEHEKVIRLSDTGRSPTDSAVQGRECIRAVMRDPPGQKKRISIAEYMKTLEGLTYEVVFAEGFKNLELGFTAALASQFLMESNAHLKQQLAGFVRLAAKRQKWSLGAEWWRTISFGVFAEAVYILITTPETGPPDGALERVRKVKCQALDLFYDVMNDELEALADLDGSTDQAVVTACSFLRDRNNSQTVLLEWMFASQVRAERNRISHPFNFPSKSPLAQQLYEKLCTSEFVEKMPHVSILGGLTLAKFSKTSMDTLSKEKKESLNEDNAAMQSLRELCLGMETEEF